MSEMVKLCSHVKTDGIVCGSPAMGGGELCYHHSTVKTALGKVQATDPLPFVFPEDRASLQINLFMLLQAYNEGRIEQAMFNSLFGLLRVMAKNLGRTGSLVRESDQRSAVNDQEDGAQSSELRAQEKVKGQRDTEGELASLIASAAPLKAASCFSKTGSTKQLDRFQASVNGGSAEAQRIVDGRLRSRLRR